LDISQKINKPKDTQKMSYTANTILYYIKMPRSIPFIVVLITYIVSIVLIMKDFDKTINKLIIQ